MPSLLRVRCWMCLAWTPCRSQVSCLSCSPVTRVRSWCVIVLQVYARARGFGDACTLLAATGIELLLATPSAHVLTQSLCELLNVRNRAIIVPSASLPACICACREGHGHRLRHVRVHQQELREGPALINALPYVRVGRPGLLLLCGWHKQLHGPRPEGWIRINTCLANRRFGLDLEAVLLVEPHISLFLR